MKEKFVVRVEWDQPFPNSHIASVRTEFIYMQSDKESIHERTGEAIVNSGKP